ncbi:hypothetical protein I4U23_025529 [Adineta vaga]|nr:hypothetical protein I4U23_025529 [Adineta vaga]
MFRTLRNHWKKSLFAFCAVSYGSKWSYDRYQANKIRAFYCRQASILGSQTFPSMNRLNRVAVLLNGKANNGKAKSLYDKTIFPLLHLIGLDVRVYRVDTITDPNGLTDLLTNKIEPNEISALMIVGGDGTLSELTPYLLESTVLENLPICIVPIGEHVSFARSLLPTTNKKKLHDDISLLCESVFALFNGTIVRSPLLKITTSDSDDKPIYASTFDFGHYSRLEQLQKRLWYFSYLKYPITSIYHFMTNSLTSVLASEQPAILYSRSCSGCLRCQPYLLEQYNLSQQQQQQQGQKTSFFSRVYQSKRTIVKSTPIVLSPPVENPDCGVEYCLNTEKQPIQIWTKLHGNENNIQVDFSDDLQRFNYDKEKYPKQSLYVQHLRFSPNTNLIPKQLLINHEKLKESDKLPNEYRIELSEKTLKFIQITDDLLLRNKSSIKATVNELEEDALEKKGIFLFPRRRHQHTQSS